MFVSYAQNFEDVILNRVFKDKEQGFYIDVGANHPFFDSVTLAFYQRGWRGINIEPIQSNYELFVKDRPRDINLNIALGESKAELEFFELIGTGFSTLDRDIAFALVQEKGLNLNNYTVPVYSLAEIWAEYVDQPVDFLKIDVEGWEEYVVKGNDWQRFRPTVLVIEATVPGHSQYRENQVEDILRSGDYRKVYFDGLNDFYLSQESSPLSLHFQVPPNVFDEFELNKYLDMKKHADNLANILQERDHEIQNHILENTNLKQSIDAQSHAQIAYEKEIIQNQTQINELLSLVEDFHKIELELKNQLKALTSELHIKETEINQLNRAIEIKSNYLLDEKFETQRLMTELKKQKLLFEQDLATLRNATTQVRLDLEQKEHQAHLSHHYIHSLTERIQAMESSKFWQMRSRWFNVKRGLGLPDNE